MGVVFDPCVFVQHLYQAAAGFWDEVENTVAGERKEKKKRRSRKGKTCKQAGVFKRERAHLPDRAQINSQFNRTPDKICAQNQFQSAHFGVSLISAVLGSNHAACTQMMLNHN